MRSSFGICRTGAFAVTIRPRDEVDGASHVDVVGDLDLASRGRLVSAFATCLDQASRRVELDLRGVTFVDCAGRAGLLACCSRALTRDVRMVMVEPSPAVTRLLPPDLVTALGIPVWMEPGQTSGGGRRAAVREL